MAFTSFIIAAKHYKENIKPEEIGLETKDLN